MTRLINVLLLAVFLSASATLNAQTNAPQPEGQPTVYLFCNEAKKMTPLCLQVIDQLHPWWLAKRRNASARLFFVVAKTNEGNYLLHYEVRGEVTLAAIVLGIMFFQEQLLEYGEFEMTPKNATPQNIVAVLQELLAPTVIKKPKHIELLGPPSIGFAPAAAPDPPWGRPAVFVLC